MHVPSKVEICVGEVICIIDANVDGLRRNVEPLIGDSGRARLARECLKIWSWSTRWRLGLITLEHHVQKSLDMHELVLKAHPNRLGDGAGNPFWAGCIQRP